MKAKKSQILKIIIFIILIIILFYIAFINKNNDQDNLKNLGIDSSKNENSGHSATGEITIEVQ